MGAAAVSIATDDILHFHRGSAQEVETLTESPLASLDQVWQEKGVRPQVSKAFDLQSHAEALAITLGNGMLLTPRARRLQPMVLLCLLSDVRSPLLRPPTNSQGPTHFLGPALPLGAPPIPPHTEGAGYHTSHNTMPARQQESKIYDQGIRTGRPGMTYRCSCVCQMCAQKTLACRYLASNGLTPK